jgi:signal transduction histidine kinase
MYRLQEASGLRILLIEDSKPEALYIERTLTQAGPNVYRVKKAYSIAQAAALLQAHEFDVGLLDLGLPDSIGFSGLNTIINLAPKLPVVILTGMNDPEIEITALERGAQDYLLKDMASISALSRAMRNAIQRKHIENMKSEFVSVVSHELRTPLTSIHGALGLIEGRLHEGVPEQVMRLINIAYKNSERLIALVNDIVDIEKIDAGRMYFDMRNEPLSDLIRQAVETNQAYADKFNVQITAGPVRKNMVVAVDGSRLIQVLSNFLSNAAKYAEPGQEILLRVEDHSGQARVSVRDFGAGIKPEFHPHLFTKFSQADSAITRSKGGAGLGLYICKQIIEHMGGDVGFSSELGKGSTFWFDLPLVKADSKADDVSEDDQRRVAS